ncbi:Nitrate-transporting ATPase [Handroanthus impetiginosus]|uniref:Nitrate-transporting ATPase n=1 Tax=Handroanthus impetiginosus TaxID=429701 RepID=A0A2G9FWA7_9LAMI|nr:Nitrate-transporting ATPase [Handroanthus impetiginosus]
MSLIIFQAKNMNTNLGSLKIPPASMQIFTLISTFVTTSILDRLPFPLWEKLFQKPLTPLQRVGIGHFFTVLGMAISAIVESKRLTLEKSKNRETENLINDVTMSVLWIAPQLVVVGVAEAFHFAGQIAFHYHEFPETMRSISTAAVAMSNCRLVLLSI